MDSELDKLVTGHDLTDFMMVVLTEVVAAVCEKPSDASARLETISNRLYDWSRDIPNGPIKALTRATALKLIQTEPGLD